jgi:DNA-binding transcriptional LysR family regulator
LERLLGFALFQRTSRRVALTVQGRQFLDNAKRLIMETDWINKAARDILANQLRIGAAHYSSQIFERRMVIEQFLGEHPDTPLQVRSRSPEQLYAELGRQELDLAITLEPERDRAGVSVVTPEVAEEFERLSLGRRPLRIWVPSGHAWCSEAVIPPGAFAGQSILIISRAHGVNLSEAISRRLDEAGANLVHPPEGDAVSAARYAALIGAPAVDLGWFQDMGPPLAASMVSLPAADLSLNIHLTLLRSRRPQRPAADRFWAFAERRRDGL